MQVSRWPWPRSTPHYRRQRRRMRRACRRRSRSRCVRIGSQPGAGLGKYPAVANTWHLFRAKDAPVRHDGVVSEIPRKSSARTVKLASIPLGMAGRDAMGSGRNLAGGDKGEIDTLLSASVAAPLLSVLGELTVVAMKHGKTRN